MILVNNLSRFKIDTEKVKLKASKILKLLGIFNYWYLEINILSPLKMAALHKKFLKKPGPTTVISVEAGSNFPVGKFSGGGEIYLCLQEIGKSGFDLEYFLVHGILHLCGYNHKTKKQEKEMLAKEEQICAKIS